MSKQIAGGNDQPRATFNIDRDKLEAFDALCQDEGVSRSEKLRELVTGYVEANTDTEPDTPKRPPDDPRLAKAYHHLYQLAKDRRDSELRIRKDTVKDELYSNDVPKEAVFSRLIFPLQDRGYVQVEAGMYEVWVYL